MNKKIFFVAIFLLLYTMVKSQTPFKFAHHLDTQYFGVNKMQLRLKENNLDRTFTSNLKGVITKRNKDTLFLKLWPTLKLKNTNQLYGVKSGKGEEHEKDYYILVCDWYMYGKKYKKIKIPFSHTQFTATTIPFRIKFRDSTTYEGEFLNANVTYLWVKGVTTIYESEFVKPFNQVWAFGPFVGLSELKNPVSEKNEFAANIGINVLRGIGKFNLVIAVGGEFGFTKETKRVNPYLGFGFGFGLSEMFEHEIKSD